LVRRTLFLLSVVEEGEQLTAEECSAPRRTLPLNFFAFSGKPKQVENLSYEERLELIRAVAQKLKMQQAIPQRKVNEFRGIVPYPFFGEDAQAWISRTRQEGDSHWLVYLFSRLAND
jgi:hypothetical protein